VFVAFFHALVTRRPLVLLCIGRFSCMGAVAQSKERAFLLSLTDTEKFPSSILLPLLTTSFVTMVKPTLMKEKTTKWIWASCEGKRSQWKSLKNFCGVRMIMICVRFGKFWNTESQNHRMVGVGRVLCGSSSSTPPLKQDHLQQPAQDLVQAGLEYCQRRRIHNLPGQPVPVLRHPQREEVLPHVQTELPVLQFVPIAPCPLAGHH